MRMASRTVDGGCKVLSGGPIIRDSGGTASSHWGGVADWFGGRAAETEDATGGFDHHGPARISLGLVEIEKSSRLLPWAVRGAFKRR